MRCNPPIQVRQHVAAPDLPDEKLPEARQHAPTATSRKTLLLPLLLLFLVLLLVLLSVLLLLLLLLLLLSYIYKHIYIYIYIYVATSCNKNPHSSESRVEKLGNFPLSEENYPFTIDIHTHTPAQKSNENIILFILNENPFVI